ncbi:MAG TPA: acyl carrier protein [Acidobacteriaceae bacterium]|nr:acyl carrier protein [Acidobacteriaceae bacterium]
MQKVPTSLRDILADTLEISPEEVTPELNTEAVEAWDSFRHLQLMLAVEGEYGVQFDPRQIPELTSVRKIQDALESKGVSL